MIDVLNDPDKIVAKVVEQSGKTETEVRKLIKNKVDSFGGMLTEGGAAYSVANDLKVKLTDGAQTPAFQANDEPLKKLKLNQIEAGMDNLELLVNVKEVFAPKTFEKDGKHGTLCSLTVADETGEARLTLWHRDVDLVASGKIKTDTPILLKKVYVKEFKGEKNLSVAFNGDIIVNPEGSNKLPSFTITYTTVKDIKEGDMNVNILGKIANIGQIRTFNSQGRDGKVANLEVSDSTGSIRIALWGDNANVIEKLELEDVVEINNAYSKDGLNGVELNVGWRGTVIVNPDNEQAKKVRETAVAVKGSETLQINELKEGLSGIVKGTVVNFYNTGSYPACEKCGKKVGSLDQTNCAKCGEVKGVKRLVLPFDLDDGSGAIRCVLFGEDALKLLQLADANDDEKIENNKTMSVGKRVALSGSTRLDDYSNDLNFTANKLVSTQVDPVKEAQAVMTNL